MPPRDTTSSGRVPLSLDCFWRHTPPATQLFPCLDGENLVCSRCCVEKCPVETPHWFAACAAAGHPTWPAANGTIPRKLVCLESSWDNSVFQTTSVKGFLESLAPLLQPPLRVAHRFIESARHLAHYTRQPSGTLWTDPAAWDAPIYYLAFHGVAGAVKATLEQLDAADLCDAFAGYGDYNCLLYLSACSVLKGAKGRRFANDLLDASGARAVIGYTTDVNWLDSLVVDLLFLYRFYSHNDPWNNLGDIYASVKRDFQPARKMGYTLVQGDD